MKTKYSSKVAGIGIPQLIAAGLIPGQLFYFWCSKCLSYQADERPGLSSLKESFKTFLGSLIILAACLVTWVVIIGRGFPSEVTNSNVGRIFTVSLFTIASIIGVLAHMKDATHLFAFMEDIRRLDRAVRGSNSHVISDKNRGIFLFSWIDDIRLPLYRVLISYALDIKSRELDGDDTGDEEERKYLENTRRSFHQEIFPLIGMFYEQNPETPLVKWSKPNLFSVAGIIAQMIKDKCPQQQIEDIIQTAYDGKVKMVKVP
jgi:hypothetical protein